MAWTRNEMARRLAQDIPPGSYVNVGIGMPELVAEYFRSEDEILLHSENGIIGMGPAAVSSDIDLDLINAGKKPITMRIGGSFFDHPTSFGMMRGGHLDYCVLGAFQVSHSGDLANWSLGKPTIPPAVGGAMDLAVGAKKVYVLMEHLTRDGKSKILNACTLPLTGRGVVDRIYTDLAVLEIADGVMRVLQMADGLSLEQLRSFTECPIEF